MVEIEKYFLSIFGSNENFKFAFEINWPLEHVNNPGSPTPDFDDDENCTSIVVIALFIM